jgi:hypothetical protein
MILIGKVKSNSFYNDDEKSDEGFDERRYGDRRNRVLKKSPLYINTYLNIYFKLVDILKDSYSPRKGGSSRYSPSNSKEDTKRNRRRGLVLV